MRSGSLLRLMQRVPRRLVSSRLVPPGPAPEAETLEAWYAALLAGAGEGAAAGTASDRYCLKPGYRSRETLAYAPDRDRGIVHQPDVYGVAAVIARQTGASSLVDVGCGHAAKLASYASDFRTIGIDLQDTIRACRRAYPALRWEECDLDRSHTLPVSDEDLGQSVIVCADVVEHLVHPEHLLASLRRALRHAVALVISTPERDLTRGVRDMGPPANHSHVREWNIAEFSLLLHHHDLVPHRLGLTRSDNKTEEMHTIIGVVSGERRGANTKAPAP